MLATACNYIMTASFPFTAENKSSEQIVPLLVGVLVPTAAVVFIVLVLLIIVLWCVRRCRLPCQDPRSPAARRDQDITLSRRSQRELDGSEFVGYQESELSGQQHDERPRQPHFEEHLDEPQEDHSHQEDQKFTCYVQFYVVDQIGSLVKALKVLEVSCFSLCSHPIIIIKYDINTYTDIKFINHRN